MAKNQVEKSAQSAGEIKAGMAVEATHGDLGEDDISKPKVKGVVRDAHGDVAKIVVEKGALFKKQLEIPANRIQSVDMAGGPDGVGVVRVDASEVELEALSTVGPEELADANEHELRERQQDSGVLREIEENIPTAEGVREMELSNRLAASDAEEREETPQPDAKRRGGIPELLRTLGPGFMAGAAGNDASAVTAYSIDGAQNGYGHLWLLLLSTPMYQAVQYTCAKIGRVTRMGLAEVLREHYGRWVAIIAAMVLIVANLSLITADLVAVGSGLELITGIHWIWFVVPVAALIWYFTVFRDFEALKKIFIIMSLAFIVYAFTAILSHPNWGTVLYNTFVPHVDFNFGSISAAVALLGATISPYNIFWQVQGEKEEKRPGTLPQKIRLAALDIATGVISGNLVAYFIILTTATTIFANPKHHNSIQTAADAAQALVYVLGPVAKYLFSIGLIGAGLVAIPVLLASTSYAVAGTFGWPVGLSKKPWQNEGFYLILTVALLISVGMSLLHLDPITLIFWANVISGVLAPILVVYLIFIGNSRKVMRDQSLSWLTNVILVLTALVMVTAAVLLFYGLFTGQG
ncbi:hypothetical protein KDA_43660 [Dictyobacter alpinus]|uniref:Iron transporter n=1 Tax=Dictyobacter alpinus TaxID=2014873 RepID=A0A402BC62_9CHLR|nr:divalent metal cation transporter [Dictyobacter alpinus]GCE28882.1 hypothetical protein KDA_43660 [Dictyobacter alpinus]